MSENRWKDASWQCGDCQSCADADREQCYQDRNEEPRGLTIEQGCEVFFAKTKTTIDAMLKDMEKLKNPLANMGYYGVESAKEHWKLKEYIRKLKKIKEVIENE